MPKFVVDDLRITQETLLWDGADRVEFRTHVDGSVGHDRLLRVRFPARVPGGLPLYQTALAVIGRSPGSADTDVAEHDYTLDNPAHEWFGVGSTARVAVSGPAGGRRMHAIGVAEVITPKFLDGCQEAVRELMVALARAGVTATCARPDGPRYGSIDVDSNLPDVRIALGGPAENPFTAAVLAAAGRGPAPGAPALAGPGVFWVPAARSRRDAFAPGSDLRGVTDLPVLVVAGGDVPAAITGLAADLADAVIEARGGAAEGGGAEELADLSVALLNRGTPGSLVTPDGTLLISLMRSCSSWPCGVWIDGDKRATPDGSSFAWQHWSHTFEYALAAGPGDWRSAGFPLAGVDYNHDLLACETGLHDGPLPATASLAAADPPTAVLSALKPLRQSAVSRGGRAARTAGRGGGPAARRVRADRAHQRVGGAVHRDRGGQRHRPVRGSRRPAAAGARRRCRGGAAASGNRDHGADPRPAAGRRRCGTRFAAGAGAARARTAGVHPLLAARQGPAPAGNLPVAVHLSPARTALLPGAAEGSGDATAGLRLTVACGTAPASGTVHLDPGAQLALEPAGPLRYDLGARGHASWDLTVRALPGAASGRRFVAARIADGGQVFEDAVLVSVGEPAAPALDLPLNDLFPLYVADQQKLAAELDLALLTPQLRLRPGERGEIAVRLGNTTAAQIRGEAQLVSPFGSWAEARPWTQGFAAEPGGELTLGVTVTVPPTARPGQHWWALVKVMYFGRARYSESASVTVVAG